MQTEQLPYSIRQRLGHAPDQEIANDANCSVQTILAARLALGLPSCVSESSAKERAWSPIPAGGNEGQGLGKLSTTHPVQ